MLGVDVITPKANPHFDFYPITSAQTIPLAEASVDVIISCDVLEHVEDVPLTLSEIARVLVPGGKFIGFVPMEGGFTPHSFFRLFSKNIFRDTKDHKVNYTLDGLRSLFNANFDVVDLEYSYHLLGSTLDASFFASFKLPGLGPKIEGYWRGQDNVVYRKDAGES